MASGTEGHATARQRTYLSRLYGAAAVSQICDSAVLHNSSQLAATSKMRRNVPEGPRVLVEVGQDEHSSRGSRAGELDDMPARTISVEKARSLLSPLCDAWAAPHRAHRRDSSSRAKTSGAGVRWPGVAPLPTNCA